MSSSEINKNEVDIVIGALNADLTQFLNSWKPFFSGFHLIIVKDPELKDDLNIPEGFDVDVYSKPDIEKVVGAANAAMFSGYSCRYFGYLVSKKKYIVSIDDDCVPAKDPKGVLVDAVSQHVTNLENPATPLFFNTLYDPYCEGADFVRGYPFSLRSGVPCAASCGLWLNLADLDAPTQALKTEQRNTSYVDAVMTVPLKAMLPISGINIAFNRELVGPALVPALRIAGEGKVRRWELYGLPCAHAAAALISCGQNVHMFAEPCFTVSSYQQTYSGVIKEVADRRMWKEEGGEGGLMRIRPPKTRRPPGRPKKKVVRVENLKRPKRIVQCGRCHLLGHSQKKCTQPI
ncbi:hypothetical protein F2Q70_00006028 [Brassica cretica]|uniref:Zinc finger PMZ-type domain-containing protein n=1 Tax=Brassica cretica TaxID=69181 RepID=A0A8S9IJI7_BRACR|nr:hypothetical protein F2Q70_00006028 [Brassica cretica]